MEEIKFTFAVTMDQYKKLEKWIGEQNTKAIKIQKRKVKNPDTCYTVCWDMGFPYCGAIGGELAYEFTPTGLGEILVVKHAVTKEEINLTDFGSW